MTPDKIYIPGKWLHVPKNHFETEPSYDCTEYIRKDALLERLEKVSAEYKKRSDEGELVWQNMCGINEAIGILNEM